MPIFSSLLRCAFASLLLLGFVGCETLVVETVPTDGADDEQPSDSGDEDASDPGNDASGDDSGSSDDDDNRNPGGNPPGGNPPGGDPPGGGGNDPDPEPVGGSCAPVAGLACGSTMSATTAGPGATSAIDGYTISTWDASGPELAYAFTASSSETVTASLSDIEAGQDLDIYILQSNGSGCHSDNSIAYGNVEASWEAVAGQTYYVVVDGYVGAAGSFVLDLLCGEQAPTDNVPPAGDPGNNGGNGGNGGNGANGANGANERKREKDPQKTNQIN